MTSASSPFRADHVKMGGGHRRVQLLHVRPSMIGVISFSFGGVPLRVTVPVMSPAVACSAAPAPRPRSAGTDYSYSISLFRKQKELSTESCGK